MGQAARQPIEFFVIQVAIPGGHGQSIGRASRLLNDKFVNAAIHRKQTLRGIPPFEKLAILRRHDGGGRFRF